MVAKGSVLQEYPGQLLQISCADRNKRRSQKKRENVLVLRVSYSNQENCTPCRRWPDHEYISDVFLRKSRADGGSIIQGHGVITGPGGAPNTISRAPYPKTGRSGGSMLLAGGRGRRRGVAGIIAPKVWQGPGDSCRAFQGSLTLPCHPTYRVCRLSRLFAESCNLIHPTDAAFAQQRRI